MPEVVHLSVHLHTPPSINLGVAQGLYGMDAFGNRVCVGGCHMALCAH